MKLATIIFMFVYIAACTSTHFDSAAVSGSQLSASTDGASGDVTQPSEPTSPSGPAQADACDGHFNYINGEAFDASPGAMMASYQRSMDKYGVGISGCDNHLTGISGLSYPDRYISIAGNRNTLSDITGPNYKEYIPWIMITGDDSTLTNVQNVDAPIAITGNGSSLDLSGATTDLFQKINDTAVSDIPAENNYTLINITGNGAVGCVSAFEEGLQHQVAPGVYVNGGLSINIGKGASNYGLQNILYLTIVGNNVNFCN